MTEVKYVKPYVFYVAHRRTFLQRFWHSRFVNRLRWMSHGHSDCYSTRVPRWVRADISQASMTFAVKRELPTRYNLEGAGEPCGDGPHGLHGFDYVVCSSRQREPEWRQRELAIWYQTEKPCWNISNEYDMKRVLERIADKYKEKVVVMQGESYEKNGKPRFIPTKLVVNKKTMDIAEAKAFIRGQEWRNSYWKRKERVRI